MEALKSNGSSASTLVNIYSVSMFIKLQSLPDEKQTLLGMPKKPSTGQAVGEVFIHSDGMIGLFEKPTAKQRYQYSNVEQVQIKPGDWTLLTVCIDCTAGRLETFVNGQLATQIIDDENDELNLDGSLAIDPSQGLTLLGMRDSRGRPGFAKYAQGGQLRCVSITSSYLDISAVLSWQVPRGVWTCKQKQCMQTKKGKDGSCEEGEEGNSSSEEEEEGNSSSEEEEEEEEEKQEEEDKGEARVACLKPDEQTNFRNGPDAQDCMCCWKKRTKSGTRPVDDADPEHPGLTLVVADSFEELVMDESKHVVVLVTADWCPPSVEMYPEYYRLARVLNNHEHIRVCKIDGDGNMLDRHLVPENHYPNVKLFPKNKKRTPVCLYKHMSRTFDSFVQWIQEETGVSLAALLSARFPDFCARKGVETRLNEMLAALSNTVPLPLCPRQFMASYFMDPAAFRRRLVLIVLCRVPCRLIRPFH